MRSSLPVRRLSLIAVATLAGCAATKVVPTPNHEEAVPADVGHQEGTFTGDGDLKLFYQSWRPKGAPTRATLVIMHGLKDYSGHYAAFAESLTRQGFAVYGFDLRGHGRSEGERVYVDSFNQYIDDLGTFFKLVEEKEPGHPIFLFGHSMGGAIVTLYTLARHPHLQGLALSGPALMPGSDVGMFKIRLTKLLAATMPRLGVLDLENASFSRDPAVVKAMDDDPLIYQRKGAARTAAELLRAMATIQRHQDELSVPLLDMHGTADKLTNPEGSKRLVERAASKDKTLKLYDGLFHDLLHEPEKAQVTADLTAWLVAHLPPPEPAAKSPEPEAKTPEQPAKPDQPADAEAKAPQPESKPPAADAKKDPVLP